MGKVRVAIYGAGVGGLSAAHELCKHRDVFEVHVYEATSQVGGKACSQFLEGTGTGGRLGLPGEHGFRFFPAFYAHLDRTMAEIPAPDGRSVLEHLVGSDEFAVARKGKGPSVARRRLGTGVQSVTAAVDALSAWFAQDALDLTAADFGNFAYAMTKFLMSCEQRRVDQYDLLSWYEFSQSDSRLVTENYRTLLASLPRTMVAMDGRHGSAYTIGKVGAQLFFLDPMRDASLDRVLDGPTSTVWLEPWFEYLRANGVHFHFGEPLDRFELQGDRGAVSIGRAHLASGHVVEADYHVCAIPIERFVPIIDDDLARCSAQLRDVRRYLANSTDWMVGAQYFLRRPVPICAGHVVYPDSPWALTSISQEQFWSNERHVGARYGDGELGGVLSVDISNWNAVAPRLGRAARACTREEILDEVFAQLLDGLNRKDRATLRREDVIARHLDQNIGFDSSTNRVARNQTPLFVHQPGGFKYRPSIRPGIHNLMLAADFVSTDTNLASMEGANEAARRCVGHILHERVTRLPRPFTRRLGEPAAFAPFKRMDAWFMSRGLDFDHTLDISSQNLAELVSEAERKTSSVSVAELRHRIGRSSTLRGFNAVREPIERVQATLGHLRGSLSRAQRLVSRKTVSMPRRRRRVRSGVRPNSAPRTGPPRSVRASRDSSISA